MNKPKYPVTLNLWQCGTRSLKFLTQIFLASVGNLFDVIESIDSRMFWIRLCTLHFCYTVEVQKPFLGFSQRIIQGLSDQTLFWCESLPNNSICVVLYFFFVVCALELVSKELNHFGVIAGLFRQIEGHSSRFVLFCSFWRLFNIKVIKSVKVFPFYFWKIITFFFTS